MKKKLAVIFACLLTASMSLEVVFNNFRPLGSESDGLSSYAPKVNELATHQDYLKDYALSDDSVIKSSVDADSEVWAIVKFKSDSLLDKAVERGEEVSEYSVSEEGTAYRQQLLSEQKTYFAARRSVIEEVKYNYVTALNGVAVRVRYGDLSKLSTGAVESVILSEVYEPQKIVQNEVDVYSSGIFNTSNIDYDGSGTAVAILDTGLDRSHAAFQKDPDGEVVFDQDAIRQKFDGLNASTLVPEGSTVTARVEDVYYSKKVPFAFDYADKDPDVYPVNDHGTHVGGIIAGRDESEVLQDGTSFIGVAPEAQLVICKVFSNVDEGAETVDILAALDDCVKLGVDAINMSLGASSGFAREEDEKNINEIYDSVLNAGISLVVAASNSYSSAYQTTYGDTNLTSNPDSGTIGSPASYQASFSVASVSGVKTSYLVANGNKEIYFTEAAKVNGEKRKFVSEILGNLASGSYQYVTLPGVGEDSSYSGTDVRGKIAVVKRGGGVSFETKVNIAEEKGAVGVIIYNNVSGTISMSIGKSNLPACSISMDLGSYFEQNPTGTLVFNKDYLAGPFMSGFSSWGVLPNLELAPDITAHGGEIYSAVRGGYDTYSGTSMACPNMCGATVLVREYVKETYPELTPQEVTAMTYRLMMSTSTIVYDEDDLPYSPRKQGSGLANIANSLNTPAYLSVKGQQKPTISLGDDAKRKGVYEMEFQLCNMQNKALSYYVDPVVFSETVSSDNKTVAQKAHIFDDCNYTVSVSGGSYKNGYVSVKGYGTATIKVTLKLTAADKEYIDKNFVNGMFVEGFVNLVSNNRDNIDLSLPYLAFYGDWAQAPMLDVSAYEVGASEADKAILEEDKLKADVYATIPMGGFMNGDKVAYWGLGQTGFNLATGYTAGPILEEYAAITNDNKNGNYTLYAVSAGLLRGSKETRWRIEDALTGETVATGVDYNARKSTWSGGRGGGFVEINFDAHELGLKNNSCYNFYMDCSLDWEGDQSAQAKNKFKFTFYIDNEDPVLINNGDYKTTVRYSKTGNEITAYYLDVYVFDNRYMQGYFMATFDSVASDGTLNGRYNITDGMVPLYEQKGNTVNKITIDITRYYDVIKAHDYQLYLQFYDYAKNSSAYTIDLSPADVEGINFKKDTISIKKNETVDLTSTNYLEILPARTWTDDLVWTSLNEDVASVSDSGRVTGLSEGTAVIQATTKDGKISDTIEVRVSASSSSSAGYYGIEVDYRALDLERGESQTITAKVLPESFDASTLQFVWTSTNSEVASVVPDPKDPLRAVVTAKKTGSATISVSIKGRLYNAETSVRVKEEFVTEGTVLRKYVGRGDENGVVTIPDDLGIVGIFNYAFMNNKFVKKIIIPEGVETIYEAAVYGCDNLEEVVLPDSIKQINKWAFGWNPSLKAINLENVQAVGDLAFYNARNLQYSSIERDAAGNITATHPLDFGRMTNVGYMSFAFCESIGEIDLSGLKAIGERAFVYCSSITEAVICEGASIGKLAFAFCEGIKNIELHCKSVGVAAFAYCTGATTVTTYGEMDTIGQEAFSNCTSLEDINFKGTVRVFDTYAFTACTSLTSVIIPSGLEQLGNLAFSGCSNIASVTFASGAKIKSISRAPFNGCSKLSEFNVESNNKYLSSNDGILYDKSMQTLLLSPATKAYVTPVSTVSVIASNAFAGSSITSIDFSDTALRSIGKEAFYASGLKTIVLPDTVEEIGDYAFAQCSSLTFASNLPAALVSLGESAFHSAKFKNSTVNLPENLQAIGKGSFYRSNLTTVNFNANLSVIGDMAFAYTNFAELVIPGTIKHIGESAFYNVANLKTVTVSEGVETIGTAAFAKNTKLTSVTILADLIAIPNNLFEGCTALETFTIPDGVTKIGDYSFYQTAVKTLNLDNIVEVGIGGLASTRLENVNMPSLKKLGSYALYCPLYISPLKSFSAPLLEDVGDFAFYDCRWLSLVDIPSAQKIGASAFEYCIRLESISLPKVTSIAGRAFANCSLLSSIDLKSVESIGGSDGRVFFGTDLTSVSLPASIAYIHPQTFISMPKLQNIFVADGSRYFDEDGVLYKNYDGVGCELVAYPVARGDHSGDAPVYNDAYAVKAGTVKIGEYAMYSAVNLKKVTLPNGLKVIGDMAMYGCTALETIESFAVEAPTLESGFSADQDGFNGMTYANFVKTIVAASSSPLTVKLIVPSNGIGYDGFVWKSYFGNISATGEVQPNEMANYLVKEIGSLDIDALTAADYDRVMLLEKQYDSLNKVQQQFVGNYSKLAEAVKKVTALARG